MMDGGGSSSKHVVDWDNDIEVDLDKWIEEVLADNLGESAKDSGVDTTDVDPNHPSEPVKSTINDGTNLEGGSSNVSQAEMAQEVMPVSSSTPSSNTTAMQSEGILSSAVKLISTISAQSSQSQTNTNFLQHHTLQPAEGPQYLTIPPAQGPQHQPLLQQDRKGKGVQQPTTRSSANPSNMTLGNQMNQLHYQMPLNPLLPCTAPLLINTQAGNLQYSQALRVQILQNLNQQQLQLPQATGSLGNLMSVGRQQGCVNSLNLSAPVGFAPPSQFLSSTAYREYVIRQIRKMKERYSNDLLKMHYNAIELRTRAKNMDDSDNYQKVQDYLEKMIAFLDTSRADLLPRSDEVVYDYMNTFVNFMCYHMNRPGGFSQRRGPAHQPPNGPQVQPLGAIKWQNNPSLNLSQRLANLEASMLKFNQNFPSRRPHVQPQESRMQSSLNSISVQKPANPPSIGSFKAPQPGVSSTIQPISLGANSTNVIGSGSPLSLLSSTTANNFPSRLLNHQPPVVNQNLNLDKMKAPMDKTNEITESKVSQGMSPPCSGLVNQGSSPQASLPSTVNPTTQPTPVSSSRFDVNSVLTPHVIARSPFLLSSTSSPSSNQHSSGVSSSSTEDIQKTKAPMDPPPQEQENSKDQVFHLADLAKSVSPNALGSASNDISSNEKAVEVIPKCVSFNLVGTYIQDDTNVMLENDHGPLQKTKRELSAPSVYGDQSASQGQGIHSTETSMNKKTKIENTWAILEEIKEINSKLFETSISVVIDTFEDNINMLEAHEGTIVKCLFNSVCFPDLLDPQGGVTPEKIPEFVMLLAVPANYPASTPTIIKSSHNVLNEPWGKLYEEMMTKFDLSLSEVTGIPSLGDIARNWDASVRAVVTEFMQKRGGHVFSSRYGSSDNCMNGSSTSK